MKTKLLYLSLLIIFLAGLFCFVWYKNESTTRINTDESEIARLTLDGQELKILTSTNLLNRNFVFLDNKIDTIVTAFSVSNSILESPNYHIIRGGTHDWLVLTRIESSGTGYMDRFDDWYVLGRSGNMKEVLIYPSQGYEIPDENGKNKYWTTDVDNKSYTDDSAVDIKFTFKDCSIAEDGKDKVCSESSLLGHYVWNDDTEEFVLKK